jgi:porin
MVVAAGVQAVFLLVCVPGGAAQPASPQGPEGTVIAATQRLEKLGRLRDALVDRGLRLGLAYDGETFADVSGGLRRGATYHDFLNVQLTVDAHRLFGWPGATVFLYGLGTHGGKPSRFAGDAQGVSNIEAPDKWKLEEGWIQQNLFGNRFSMLGGLYDLNSEFYRVQSASVFFNSSFGIGPEFSQSGKGGPSIFPDTSLGVRFELKPARGFVLRTAILDGVPLDRPDGGQRPFAKGDGLLLVGEAAYLYRPVLAEQPLLHRFRIARFSGLRPYEGKVALGAWHYTATFDDLIGIRPDGQPVRHHGSSGLYLIADETVYKDAGPAKRRLNLFGQLGIGGPRVNEFAFYTGGGAVLSGPFPGREADELGVAMAAAHNGNPFLERQRQAGNSVGRSEMTVELTYLAQLRSWLAVQPDLQYVVNPGTDPTLKNALVTMLRFEIAF